MAVKHITPLFKAISYYRELNARISMLGSCNNGHEIIGAKTLHETRLIALVDEISSTPEGADDFQRLLDKVPHYFANFLITNSTTSALNLANRLMERASPNKFRTIFLHKESLKAVRSALSEFIATNSNKACVKTPVPQAIPQ